MANQRGGVRCQSGAGSTKASDASVAFATARKEFHKALLNGPLTSTGGVPAIADRSNPASRAIATSILVQLGWETEGIRAAGQTSGSDFEIICRDFLRQTFPLLGHLRPGTWAIDRVSSTRGGIARFEQYAHIAALMRVSREDKELAAILGNDYTITPDLVVTRQPEPDAVINAQGLLVDADVANHTPLRAVNNQLPILHASISCKWTMRSDRAQNARSEALNLIRNRKGHLPHTVVVTAEPLPSRLASLALGTGDIDCVYHFALPELQQAVSNYPDAADMLHTMVVGKRLRDIADLPLDLAL